MIEIIGRAVAAPEERESDEMVQEMFWWDQKHRDLHAEVRRFADEHRERAREIMWSRDYPWDVMEKIADRGWLGAVIPSKYGGIQESLGGVTSLAIIAEELGRVWPATWPFTLTTFGGTKQILSAGSEAQKEEWLPKIAAGKSSGAVCITEPWTGSDATNMETTATRTDDGYVLSGKKRFISNIGAAGHYLVYARLPSATDEMRKSRHHLSVFIVPNGTSGLSVERYHELGGYSYLRNGILDIDNVAVPVENRLGNEGDGWSLLTQGLNLERLLVAAGSVGNMREAISYGSTYVRRRVQFGRPVAEFQLLQSKIVDAIANLRRDRTFVHWTAAMVDQGHESALDASIAKLVSSRDAVQTCLDMVQAMGGDGVTRYYPVEQLARDMAIKGIGGGSNEVLTGLIYRLSRKDLQDEIDIDLQGYFPADLRTKDDRSPNAGASQQLLGALAEEYMANPGLYVELEQFERSVELNRNACRSSLDELVEEGLVAVWPADGEPRLVRATLAGLRKAHPTEWYRLRYPEWVGDREIAVQTPTNEENQ